MSNSLASFLQSRITAIFEDLRYTYSQPHQWERDKSRLLHEIVHHGSQVATIALPDLGKHFDRCLSEEMYVLPGLPLAGARGKRSGFPAFAEDLLLQVFNQDRSLRDDASLEAVASLRQLFYGFKKLELECPRKVVNSEVNDFLAIESQTRDHTLEWDNDNLGLGDRLDLSFHDDLSGLRVGGFDFGETDNFGVTTADAQMLQTVADIFASQLGDLHTEEDSERPKHGPGAVSNLRGKDSKYSFPNWSTKLQNTFPHDLYATTNLGVGYDGEPQPLFGLAEKPSKLIAVPKTQKGPRLIAAEPVEHQWIQQLVRSQLENRLSKTFLHSAIQFRSQDVSRAMANFGSINGSLATIDLSSASDRLSCWAVERFFRANHTLLERLHACRTRWVANGVTKNNWSQIRLKKFAPQGSSATFPVQTICYAIASVAAFLLSKGLRPTDKNLRKASAAICVFGDDIIVPVDTSECVIRLLSYLGLKVNTKKTHMKGNFRESCGMDAFRGHDVTPAYFLSPVVSASFETLSSAIEVSNNFFRKGWWRCAEQLTLELRRYRNSIPIVSLISNQPGFASFCGTKVDHLKSRWNPNLQQQEVKMFVSISKQNVLPTPGSYCLFQWFTERPNPQTKWIAGTRSREVSLMRPGWRSMLHL